MQTRKPQVLAAFPEFALATVAEIIGAHVELVPVSSLESACEELRKNPRIALVLCGVHFDQSRMYDLLRHVRARFAWMPFLCCRILNSEIPRISREAIEVAAGALGARAFLDLPTLREDVGSEQADGRFRELVLAQLELSRATNGDA